MADVRNSSIVTQATRRQRLANRLDATVKHVDTAVRHVDAACKDDEVAGESVDVAGANASGKASPQDLFESISKGIAFVAGLAAFVYIAGAAVLAVRLDKAGLPASEVVTGLPRELLFGVGLQYVVAPAVALALVAALELYFLKWWKRKSKDVWGKSDVAKALLAGLVLTAIILWILLALQRGDWLLIWEGGELRSTSGWWVAFLAAYVTTLTIFVVAKRHFNLQGFLLVALILSSVGLIAALARVVYERANPRLEEATVCVNDGGPNYEGLFVGETPNAVYLGRVKEEIPNLPARESRPSAQAVPEAEAIPGVIQAIPKDRVGELLIGDRKANRCSVPRPTQDRRVGT